MCTEAWMPEFRLTSDGDSHLRTAPASERPRGNQASAGIRIRRLAISPRRLVPPTRRNMAAQPGPAPPIARLLYCMKPKVGHAETEVRSRVQDRGGQACRERGYSSQGISH